MSRTLRVGAIQMICVPKMVEQNLNHAEALIRQAAQKGAELVLLPELMPGGYILTEEIWETAETINGRVVRWLLNTSERFGLYIGLSFLEAEGEEFYNAFVLSGPQGKLLGRVRKNPPASVESYFYKAGSGSHVIETELGRIGVSICYENLLYDQLSLLHRENVDLLLSPFAAGRPRPFVPGDIQRFDRMLVGSRAILSRTLGVPVIMANQTGPLETELPGRLPYLKSSFAGLSCIVDADATVKEELADDEGVIVADVCIEGDNTRAAAVRKHNAPANQDGQSGFKKETRLKNAPAATFPLRTKTALLFFIIGFFTTTQLFCRISGEI